jgi:transposase InsO family protein
VVEEVESGRATPNQLARTLGISRTTIDNWLQSFRAGGLEALVARPAGPPPGGKASQEREAKREAVTELREAHPEYGTRRIRDVLARFEALGVSESEVRRIPHEEGLIPPVPPRTEERTHPERRFERAEPNQLWQSDIFTFLLRRHQRVYVTVFMDDHSRFIVSHATAHHQRSELVMEALERGLAAYGTPQEILTDNGRQYAAWRGETDFQRALRQYGIRHVRSRPQHPQTLGKAERFWKTLWDEFLSRTVFADFADFARRLALFIDGYNFQRPHQALAGLVPADRYFRAAAQVREAVQKNVADNALRLAHQQPVRKPFYLVGRLGDRDLTIAASGSGLQVRLDDEETRTIELPKEDEHGHYETTEHRNQPDNREEEEEAPLATHTPLAHRAAGPGPAGAPALPDDFERAVRRASGVGGHRTGATFTTEVLRPRNARPERDAASARGGQWRGIESGDESGETDFGARATREATRDREATRRETAPSDSQGDAYQPQHETNPNEEQAPELDDPWLEAFERLEDAQVDANRATLVDDSKRGVSSFDPEAGWRGRALSWERKLAGADASLESPVSEAAHGQSEKEEDLRPDASTTAGAQRALPGDARSACGQDDGERGSETTRYRAQPLPVDAASRSRRLHPGDEPETERPTAEEPEGDGSGDRE